jgi:hypothetical protein
MMPDEIERVHKELFEFDRIEAISEPMRELIWLDPFAACLQPRCAGVSPAAGGGDG